jgi:periplasmic protein TonB
MADPKLPVPKPDRHPPTPAAQQSLQQQRLMISALVLLLLTLGFVLYRDRDFWFPDTLEADNQPLQSPTPAKAAPLTPQPQAPPIHKKAHASSRPVNDPAPAPVPDTPLPPTTIMRTVLPPLEVEVVAGSTHKRLRPGTNSVHVDLQPDPSSQQTPEDAPQDTSTTAANITTNAAEQAQVTTETASIVTHSVRPGYPTLARQMKVQGSVILQALIGRDGLIQELQVVSGPPILATAAREAVKQWHFKPHYEGSEAVETQAKITVNFTISTN